jgi:hypothetical protein
MPEWETIAEKEKYAKMARQGHGFIMALPVRVIKPEQDEGVLVNVEKEGKEIGEIVFQGNICAKGYYKDAEATRKLWAGGVLHSGDLAVWHPDGAIQILDRAKDIIISGTFPPLPFHFLPRANILCPRWRKHLFRRPRSHALNTPLHPRGRRLRRRRFALGRAAQSVCDY